MLKQVAIIFALLVLEPCHRMIQRKIIPSLQNPMHLITYEVKKAES